ncbi:hypothetical protein BC834DRAFT_856759 [Gloeopeniophorella convolvens]|nr:hypothetical protein BC834DRAFT_856759 [Gloeopeniophorella convolvens]
MIRRHGRLGQYLALASSALAVRCSGRAAYKGCPACYAAPTTPLPIRDRLVFTCSRCPSSVLSRYASLVRLRVARSITPFIRDAALSRRSCQSPPWLSCPYLKTQQLPSYRWVCRHRCTSKKHPVFSGKNSRWLRCLLGEYWLSPPSSC